MSFTPALLELVRAQSLAAGFSLSGVAPAGAVPDPHFAAWLDRGYSADMHYLARRSESGQLLRESAQAAMPWARSVIVCALNYNLPGAAPESAPAPTSLAPAPPNSAWIARYAWTADSSGLPLDYHDDLLRRLRLVESALHAQLPAQLPVQLPAQLPALHTRCYVDTGPILERDFAARAGIGWIGRNTCVINQQQGSWLLLGVIVTSLEPQPSTLTLHPDRCGSCTRCIDACPTSALLPTDPRQMDASRCIAYLTIEKKGEIPLPLRDLIGRQVFGCDICQEVCPWNRKAPTSEAPNLTRRDDLINPSLTWLASIDSPTFKRLFAGSPLSRTRRTRLLRNVAIAMGNTLDPTHILQLQLWSQTADPPLREAAAWALEKLHSASLEEAAQQKQSTSF